MSRQSRGSKKNVCHKCQVDPDTQEFAAKCSNKKCKQIFCEECILTEYDQQFDVNNYKPAYWVCYKCQDKCNCVKCLQINLQPTRLTRQRMSEKTQEKSNLQIQQIQTVNTVIQKEQKEQQQNEQNQLEINQKQNFDFQKESEESVNSTSATNNTASNQNNHQNLNNSPKQSSSFLQIQNLAENVQQQNINQTESFVLLDQEEKDQKEQQNIEEIQQPCCSNRYLRRKKLLKNKIKQNISVQESVIQFPMNTITSHN